MSVGVLPAGKVVVAPICGWVVIVPGTMSESGSAVGLVEGRDHDTEGNELKLLATVAPETAGAEAEPETAAEPDAADGATAGELAADGAEAWRAKLRAPTKGRAAAAPRTASFILGALELLVKTVVGWPEK